VPGLTSLRPSFGAASAGRNPSSTFMQSNCAIEPFPRKKQVSFAPGQHPRMHQKARSRGRNRPRSQPHLLHRTIAPDLDEPLKRDRAADQGSMRCPRWKAPLRSTGSQRMTRLPSALGSARPPSANAERCRSGPSRSLAMRLLGRGPRLVHHFTLRPVSPPKKTSDTGESLTPGGSIESPLPKCNPSRRRRTARG
jgi:hypothetical protein